MTVARELAVFLIVFAAIIFEQHLWDETMNQSPDVQTVWGQCEGCQEHKHLLEVPGHGRLCFGCEWDLIVSEMKAGGEQVTDA